MAAPQWDFEDFRLDPVNARLWRGAEPLALPPKVFDVLHYLVTHPDRLVTKDELLDTIWPHTTVTDAVVRVAIGTLRKALGDTRQPFRCIATVPRRGYRFLTPVTVVAMPEPTPAGESLRSAAPAPPPHRAAVSVPDIPAHQEEGDTWRCAMCHHPLSRTARFCVACGTPVAETCQACGQVVPLPATFCPGCGHRLEPLPAAESAHRPPASLTPLAGSLLPSRAPAGERQFVTVPERAPLADTPTSLAEQILTSRAALEGERKQVTVLFADIKDSLEVIRGLDPEAAQQLLDPAVHAMIDAVHRYAGTVNQVLGDGIMALFGAPIAYEDHAARACYAALAMQAALRDYAEEVRRAHGVALQIRVGLDAGEVVVRTMRHDLHMDYSAVGQTTHLAARLEQVAPPDTILLTATAVRLVAGLVRVKAWGPIAVKGLTEPVEVWELLGASGLRRRLQIARARGLTRFVGRQTELAALHAALAQAGAGHGQVVAVVGEAGVGKSRLVDEFVQAAHTHGWLVLDSAAVSYGQATPYFPVLGLLRRYCHLEEGEDARTIQAKVTAQVRTLDATLQDTVPALLALLDALPADSPFLQLDAQQRRRRTLAAMKLVLLRQSQVHSLLLVCEDLHWLDTETQALLDSLGESLPTARLLLLVNYRPDYRHGWGSKTYYTQLRLDPLPMASADTFLQVLLGDDPSLSPLTQLLIQCTEGNPFFLEESVRTLAETGALVGEPGAYRVAHTLPTMQVPATVQAVLAARIDRLPPEEKRLLQTAAVMGMEVPLALLQAVGELSEEALRLGLAHLQDTEFLYEARLFPDLAYTFKHALTQEVAYASLLKSVRRDVHQRLVEVLEAQCPEVVATVPELLAHHALQGERWDKAVVYFRQAGAQAFARAANRQAVACFEHGLEALKHVPESRDALAQAIDLRLDLRSPLWQLGEFPLMLERLHEAETHAQALDDHYRLGRVFAYLSRSYSMLADHQQAIDLAHRSLAIAGASADFPLEVTANFRLAQAYKAMGDYRRAVDCARRNVDALSGDLLYERFAGSTLSSVVSRWALVSSLAELGTFTEGIAYGQEAVRIAEAAGHLVTLLHAYDCLGRLYFLKGDLQQAIPVLQRGLTLCQVGDVPIWSPGFTTLLSVAYALSGQLAEALKLLEQVTERSTSRGSTFYPALRDTWLSETYLLAGEVEEASALGERALALSRAQKGQGHEAHTLRLLGDIAAWRAPVQRVLAQAHYQQALVLAEALHMRPLQAHCHRALGMLYSQTAQHAEARTALATALDMYRAMDMAWWLPQTEAMLAQSGGKP